MMEMGDQYNPQELRPLYPPASDQRLMNGRPHYGMVVMGGRSEVLLSSPPYPPPPPPPRLPTGMDAFGCIENGGGGAHGRWPRQETLTLLEIRTRLDSKFREAFQKAPLWDEVSRIMAEEHGYQRSGKKCREKLENLYKYYKKTKDGKAGRHDGKHYRFFRQLDALYGETTNPTTTNPCFHITQERQEASQSHWLQESLCLSDSSYLYTTSTDEEVDGETHKRCRRSWKSKVRGFAEMQMRRFMELQEAWLDKMLMTLEDKEQDRICREEAWRKQEAARWDQEHRLWVSEKAWIEARDAALMEALEKISVRRSKPLEEFSSMDMGGGSDDQNEMASTVLLDDNLSSRVLWPEPEITGLVKLGSSMDQRFQEDKKRRESSMGQHDDHLKRLCREGSGVNSWEGNEQAHENVGLRPSDERLSSSSNGCFRFLMGEGESLWVTDAVIKVLNAHSEGV